VPWEYTGAYEFYEALGVQIDKVVKRYRNLDRIYETVKLDGRMKTKLELDPNHFRELNGIRIHVGPSGQLFFCDAGTHRLAMAIILGIRVIPAQIGCVYRGALDEIARLRAEPNHTAALS
jgi:hypothetical protein